MTEFDNLMMAFCLGFLTGFAWFSYRLVRNIKQVMKEMGIDQDKIEEVNVDPQKSTSDFDDLASQLA